MQRSVVLLLLLATAPWSSSATTDPAVSALAIVEGDQTEEEHAHRDEAARHHRWETRHGGHTHDHHGHEHAKFNLTAETARCDREACRQARGIVLKASAAQSPVALHSCAKDMEPDRFPLNPSATGAPQFVLQPHGVRPEQLPPTCPLHPARDLFAQHEKNKLPKNAAQRQCKYCKKARRTEVEHL